MSLGRFDLRAFCPSGHFFPEMFCPWEVMSKEVLSEYLLSVLELIRKLRPITKEY